MKKVFALIVAAIVCVSASAQVQFGAKVGVDATNFWGKDTPHGMQLNYQAGLMMEYKFTDKFAIAPEVVFAAQGGKYKMKDLVENGENSTEQEIEGILSAPRKSNALDDIKNTFTTNYINIPVMLKYYVAPSFSIDFGPQLGINVYSKQKTGDMKPVDIKKVTKDIDFGLGLGGSYNLTEKAFVQARYTLGLTNVFDGDGDCKNGNIQVAFGMKF